MDKSIYQQNKISHVFFLIVVVALGIVSFTLCIVSESKKSKKKDLRLDGELCFLPQSQAFGYGIAALICLSIAQITGSGFFFFFFSKKSSFRDRQRNLKSAKPSISSILFSLSWVSFAIAMVLIGTATSMSRRQDYGEGWLDGKCYLVKNGVFVGSGILVLVAMSLMLVSCTMTLNEAQADHGQRIHAQAK